MKGLLAAIRFLTIFPLLGQGGCDQDDLRRSLVFFPLVGVLIGCLAALAAKLAWAVFPPLVAAVLLVFCLLAVSGAFHLDGLADCADGFFSSKPRERVLEIMRDSHVGVMGVVALIMVLMLKIAALTMMDASQAMLAAFIMPLAGRSLMVVNMAMLPYVRKSEGVASSFYDEAAGIKKTALWAVAILYCGLWYGGGIAGLGAGIAAFISIVIFAGYCKYKIGGATGDTLGAGCEISETVVALAMLLI